MSRAVFESEECIIPYRYVSVASVTARDGDTGHPTELTVHVVVDGITQQIKLIGQDMLAFPRGLDRYWTTRENDLKFQTYEEITASMPTVEENPEDESND